MNNLNTETALKGLTATLRDRILPALSHDPFAEEQARLSSVLLGLVAEQVDSLAAIRITDNGRGIDPRDHQRIFDLFRRSGAQDQPGEGIGLAHVNALAYRLGGAVDVASEPGKGSTFTIVLPLYFSEGPEPAP